MSRNFGRLVNREKRPVIPTPTEAVFSHDTALSCLALLSAHHDVHADPQTDRSFMDLGGGSLSLSQLIELAGEFGFRARYLYRDWQWLKLETASHPILLLLKNTNVVIAVGNGCSGVEEIVISDPLYRDGEAIILPREDLERAWDGEALTIEPQPREAEGSAANCHRNISKQPGIHRDTPYPLAEQPSIPTNPLHSLSLSKPVSILLCLVTVTLISLVLIMVATEEHLVTSAILTTSPLAPQRVSSTAEATVRLALTDNPSEFAPAVGTAELATAFAVNVGSPDSALLVVAQRLEALPASLPTPPAFTVSSVEPPSEILSIQADLVTQPKPPAEMPPATISALIMRGDDCLRIADIVSARLFYERAAGAGAAGAALRLGETYDPVFLDSAQLHGIAGDLKKAVLWYRRARDLGSNDAKLILGQLGTE